MSIRVNPRLVFFVIGAPEYNNARFITAFGLLVTKSLLLIFSHDIASPTPRRLTTQRLIRNALYMLTDGVEVCRTVVWHDTQFLLHRNSENKTGVFVFRQMSASQQLNHLDRSLSGIESGAAIGNPNRLGQNGALTKAPFKTAKAPTVLEARIGTLKILALSLLRAIESLEESAADGTAALDLQLEVHRFEAELIRSALIRTGGRQRLAARLLGMKVTTLNTKIRRYGIQ